MSRLRALIVSDRSDAPHRYRCVHACAQLRAAGAVANLLRPDDPRLLRTLGAYSVVVVFRLPWSPTVEALVQAARHSGIPLIFDCDDLVFDPGAAHLFPFRRQYAPADWEQSYGAQLRALRRTFDACDSFIGSTPALADWASKLGKPAQVHPNVVPDEYVEVAKSIRRARRRLLSSPTLGYFSGSNTHDLDFERIAPVLRGVLDRRNARLVIGGFVDIGNALPGLEHRIVRLPHVGYRTLPWALAACDATLAPISELNAFTDGKSALKFFEPGVFGIPVIASPIAEMTRAIVHGKTGWLPEDDAGWLAALDAALARTTAERVGEAARAAVLAGHTSQAVAGRLARLLEQHATKPTGKEPGLLPFRTDEYSGRADALSHAAARARRAREIVQVMRPLRETRGTRPTVAVTDALIERVLAGAGTSATVLVAGSPEKSRWRAASQLDESESPLGEHRIAGPDPHYLSPPLELEEGARYAVVRLRATSTSGRGTAQLFWLEGRRKGFRERDSVNFAVTADGVDRTYVVDLWKSSEFPRKPSRGVRFRFDPLDRPGTVRVLALALAPDGWQPEQSSVQVTAPALALGRRGREAREMLHDAESALQDRDSIWVETTRDAGWLRAQLEKHLAAAEVERLETTATGCRALLVRGSAKEERGVDIVVPVYNAREQTLRCLRSVLRHARGDYRVVVIDDASPDPKLWPALRRWAKGKDRVLLLRNAENLGFVGTCNRAFSLSEGRDVLLLNSDTVVFRGFLRRLRATAYADAHTGIVCPLSNNATICSAPDFCKNNELPSGLSAKQVAALVRKSSRQLRPELVTPVGFCMYVRGEVLAQIGPFDAERFGRGFGEENDFGERAKAAGWKIRLADDTYVWHDGKASFGEGGFELEAKNGPVLEARHPGYHAAVAHFIQQNPLAPIQDELRWQLHRHRVAAEPAPLLLLHASPFREPCGGTEYIARDVVQGLRAPRMLVAFPGESSIEVAEVLEGDWERPSLHRFPLSSAVPRFCHEHAEAGRAFEEILDLFRVGHVHVHHLIGWPLSIQEVLTRRRVPYSLTVHDFYAVCPSQNLLNPGTLGRCCPDSAADPGRTASCMRALFTELSLPVPDDPVAFVTEHRAWFARWLENAERIFFPSESAKQITGSAHTLGSKQLRVLPHAYVPAGADNSTAPIKASRRPERLRVALVGEVAYPSKGARSYLEVMSRLRGEPIEWHIFGPADRFDFERQLTALGRDVSVVKHGAYRRDELIGLLRDAGIDLGLLLPIVPETFSLTLSELLAAGVPVVASRQGALVERLDGRPYGRLVESAEQAAEVLRALSRAPEELARLRAGLARLPSPDRDAWLAAHQSLYAQHRANVNSRPLRRRDYQRLTATRVSSPGAAPPASTTQPAARFRSAAWYQRAERLKPYLPESIRALARQRLSDNGLRSLQRFRLPSRRAVAGGNLRLDARYLSTARFTSLSDDPHFELKLDPFVPESIGAICFNLWCSHPGYAYAQIYWRHEGDTAFSEEKSAIVELNARLGDWQEYVLHLSRATHPSWYAGKKIVALRFDPVSYAGLFCVGHLALCAPPAGP